MPTVITTPGAVDANSYCSVAEGDSYHETHLYASAWNSASITTKEIALIHATRLLDDMYEWAGWATEDEQPLMWPRETVLTKNGQDWLDDDVIPQDLKNATAEMARNLIIGDRTEDNAVETQGLRSLTAGSVSLSFKDSVQAKVVPDAVVNLIPDHWGRLKGSDGMLEVARA
jgi:hypothetical protein